MEIVQLLVQIFSLIGIGIIIFINKSFFSSFIKEKGKNLATKQDIKEITHKVESVRNQFQEYQTKFSLYFQKKFEVEGRIFEHLTDAEEYIRHMVHPYQEGGKEEEEIRQKQAIEAFNNFSGYFYKHKIYLPNEICVKIEELIKILKESVSKYQVGRKRNNSDMGLKMWDESWNSIKDKVPKIREDLENDLKNSLDPNG